MVLQRLFLVVLIPYVGWLIVAYEYHFIDGVNLAFHEAGHLFLRPFGQVIHFLGGTLAQLFFPAACAVHFLRNRKHFEAAVCGVWFAESMMYMAEYLGDALALSLPLVGGHIHDWNWLLGRFGLLAHCRAIAAADHALASLIAIACVGAACKLVFSPLAPEVGPAREAE